MNFKPILIVIGEPYSVFSELVFKLFNHKYYKNKKNKIILIGSKRLLEAQMKKLRFKFSFNLLNSKNIIRSQLSRRSINIIDINFKFKKPFEKISYKSQNFINQSFEKLLNCLKKNFKLFDQWSSFKKTFLKKDF